MPPGTGEEVRGLLQLHPDAAVVVPAPQRISESAVLQIIGGWRKIPDTYFRTLDGEDAQQFHRAVSPGDRLAEGARTGISKKRRSQTKPRGKL